MSSDAFLSSRALRLPVYESSDVVQKRFTLLCGQLEWLVVFEPIKQFLAEHIFDSIAVCCNQYTLGVCIVEDVGHHVPKTFPRCPKVSDDVVGR